MATLLHVPHNLPAKGALLGRRVLPRRGRRATAVDDLEAATMQMLARRASFGLAHPKLCSICSGFFL